ncbi:MAG: deoxyguanosinetriphosphate triphosphohydrolase, partial [Planctomycetes bacterium]|nr:deoxyguanosinetriphosphate triphosphohydrolase [Planctomycetota bacterium]
YAVAAALSIGRRHHEPEHPYRTCFGRDRDRIIHSAAFRRLEAKTQVFFEPKNDHLRTRLTHTIEVAQIARAIARTLAVNEDLAEAAALAHDLGHPPYGHAGEAVLDSLMKDHGGFEHNAQSIRIVEQLEHPYPDFHGLNLSLETLECLAKHKSRYARGDPKADLPPGQAPLEGQIADLADSVAYNSHDLDDALTVNLITEEDLESITLYQILKDDFLTRHPDAHRYAGTLRCAKGLIDLLVSDILESTAWRLARISPENLDDIRSAPGVIVDLSDERKTQLKQLAELLNQKVYCHPRVVQAKHRSERELTFLFESYLKDPSKLPDRFQLRLDEQGPHRVICDYLAGMTDRFCHQLTLKLKATSKIDINEPRP